MTDNTKDIADRARAIERIYTEFTQRLEVLRQKHNEELKALLAELEQKKITEIRAQLES
ncbi:hypothetical protein HY634_02600 [Candidatus Uhrbacteria bacterium]|nr:hypothetical protein [Candidatus Uhrbacteria bacterium]